MDDSRLVRSRALDVLSLVLESTANPLSVLGKDIAPSDAMDADVTDDQNQVDCKFMQCTAEYPWKLEGKK